ncbi:hypothetical protein [Flavobacterium sp.]|uniref:hypothetical protein n=1 Tax=Flavobacterium sp. TaxID=239 RepID=UPI003D6B998A
MRIVNRLFATLILLLNLYFLPFSFITIRENFGSMRGGLTLLPITLLINMLIITSVLAFKKKYEKNLGILIINLFGLLFALGLFFLLMATQRME